MEAAARAVGPGNDIGGSSGLFSPQGMGRVRAVVEGGRGLRQGSQRTASCPAFQAPPGLDRTGPAPPAWPHLPVLLPSGALLLLHPKVLLPMVPLLSCAQGWPQSPPPHSTGPHEVSTVSGQPWCPAPGSGPAQSRCPTHECRAGTQTDTRAVDNGPRNAGPEHSRASMIC